MVRVEMFTSAYLGVLIKKTKSLVTCLHKLIKLLDIFNNQKKEKKRSNSFTRWYMKY